MPRLRLPTMNEVIRLFTGSVIGGGGVFGTGVSSLMVGGLVVNLFHIWRGEIKLPRSGPVFWVSISFAYFFAADALAAAIHFDGRSSIIEIVENGFFLAFCVYYGSLARIPRAQALETVAFGAIAGGLGCGVFALLDLFVLGMQRAEGMAGNPGPFALVSAVLYALCLIVAFAHAGRMRTLALCAAAMAALALLLTGIRTLLPALAVAPLVVALVLGGSLPRPSLRQIAVGAVAVLLVALAAYPLVSARIAHVSKDIAEIESGEFDNSIGQRLYLWQRGMELAVERPIAGYGPGREASLIANDDESTALDVRFSHFHNFAIHALVRGGAIVLSAWLLVLIAPLVAVARARRDRMGDIGFAMALSIVCLYVLNGLLGILFGHDITDALYVFGLVCALYLVFGSDDPRPGADGAGRA